MKTSDEIKKGLECYFRSENYLCGPQCIGRECDLYTGNYSVAENAKDALAYIQQLEQREWEVFDLLSSAWHGKQYYFKQEDGSVYSRESCQYLTFDQAIDEFAHSLTVAEGINVPTNQPKWISVKERLPEDGVDVLVYIASKKENVDSVIAITHYTHTMHGYNIEGWCSPWQYCFWDREVTHWMHLPCAPKEEA